MYIELSLSESARDIIPNFSTTHWVRPKGQEFEAVSTGPTRPETNWHRITLITLVTFCYDNLAPYYVMYNIKLAAKSHGDRQKAKIDLASQTNGPVFFIRLTHKSLYL